MHSIPIIHTSQVFPFIQFLNRAGCPLQKLLKKAHLPQQLVEPCEGYIAERQLWELLDIAAEDEGNDQLGLDVGINTKLEDLGALAIPLRKQPTIYAMLDTFCQLARKESSHANFWLEVQPEQLLFCRGGISEFESGQHHAEMYTLMVMIKIVQIMAADNWLPTNIWLQTSTETGLENYPLLVRTNIKFGQPCTAIEVPLLPQNKKYMDNAKTAVVQAPAYTVLSIQQANALTADTGHLSFAQSIRQILPLYISTGNPGINTVAEITGLSVRTIQRELNKSGLKYIDLLQQLRFEIALELLKEPSLKLSDIAYELSYSSVSHFNRAFIRWAGMPPGRYRHIKIHNQKI